MNKPVLLFSSIVGNNKAFNTLLYTGKKLLTKTSDYRIQMQYVTKKTQYYSVQVSQVNYRALDTNVCRCTT